MKKRIESILLQLDITPNLKGFESICEAVEIISKEPRIKATMLYERIAEKDKATKSQVERRIRHALSKMNENTYKSMGGVGHTNSEILFTLAFLTRGDNNE